VSAPCSGDTEPAALGGTFSWLDAGAPCSVVLMKSLLHAPCWQQLAVDGCCCCCRRSNLRDPFRLLARLPSTVEQAVTAGSLGTPRASTTTVAPAEAGGTPRGIPSAVAAAPGNRISSPRLRGSSASLQGFLGLSVSGSDTQLAAANSAGQLVLVELECGAPVGASVQAGQPEEQQGELEEGAADAAAAAAAAAALPEEVGRGWGCLGALGPSLDQQQALLGPAVPPGKPECACAASRCPQAPSVDSRATAPGACRRPRARCACCCPASWPES
jgi:hypothetical protein